MTEESKRAPGIEPGSIAWKAMVLPLNYARAGLALQLLRLAYLLGGFICLGGIGVDGRCCAGLVDRRREPGTQEPKGLALARVGGLCGAGFML